MADLRKQCAVTIFSTECILCVQENAKGGRRRTQFVMAILLVWYRAFMYLCCRTKPTLGVWQLRHISMKARRIYIIRQVSYDRLLCMNSWPLQWTWVLLTSFMFWRFSGVVRLAWIVHPHIDSVSIGHSLQRMVGGVCTHVCWFPPSIQAACPSCHPKTSSQSL